MKKKSLFVLLILPALSSCSFIQSIFENSFSLSSGDSSSSESSTSSHSQIPEVDASYLGIRFFDLGNDNTGDCTYIRAGDYHILVDGGSRDSSRDHVYPRLDELLGEEKTIDLAIVTHADQDHIAMFGSSSNSIFHAYKVETIIDFARTGKTTQVYNRYVNNREMEISEGAIHYTALECWSADSTGTLEDKKAHRVYELGENLRLEFLYNRFYEEDTSDENNYSVAFQIIQGNNRYVFMGDAETAAEASIIESNANLGPSVLYKANHHGSGTSSSEALLATLSPEYVVSPCVVGNYEYATNPDNTFPYQRAIDHWAPYTYKILAPRVATYSGSSWGSKTLNGEILFECASTTTSNLTVTCSGEDTYLPLTDWFNETRRLKDGTLVEGTPNRTWPESGVALPNE